MKTPLMLSQSANLVAVDGAPLAVDVQGHGIHGARVGGEAHGIVLTADLLHGLLGKTPMILPKVVGL